MQIFSDEEEVQNLPSRSGLESEANSCVQISDLPFPAAADSGGMAPFPSTLLQDHQETDMQRQAAGLPPLGFSSQVNNIVRAFSIHGALNRSLLSQALTTVTNMHPILLARFQRFKGTLYMQLPSSDSGELS